MKTQIFKTLALVLSTMLSPAIAQPTTTLDLSLLATGETWAVFNRTATLSKGTQYQGIYLDEKAGQGLAWLPAFEMGDGVIEVDVKGRNLPGRSFVGLAFHGIDANHYEAVYLRPFNFRADTEVARSRAVQYMVVPSHEWRRLRTHHPGQYEAAIEPPPAADEWVHLRLELDGPTVRVFINLALEPTLVVDRIGTVEKGWIGLWVGNNSDGTFANLKAFRKQDE